MQSYLSTTQSLEIERGSLIVNLGHKCMVTSKFYVIPPFFMNTSSFNVSDRMLEFTFHNLTRLGRSPESIDFQGFSGESKSNFTYHSVFIDKLEAYEKKLDYFVPKDVHDDFKLKSYIITGAVVVIIFIVILISYKNVTTKVSKVKLNPKSVTLQELRDIYTEVSHSDTY